MADREAGMIETFEVALSRAVAADKNNERTMYLGAQHYTEKGDDVKVRVSWIPHNDVTPTCAFGSHVYRLQSITNDCSV